MRTVVATSLLPAACLAGMALAACGGPGGVHDVAPLDEGDGERVVVGVDPELPPYSFLDDAGELRGMVIDLMHELAKVQQLDMTFRFASGGQLQKALLHSDVDIVPHWPQTTETPDGITLSLPHTHVADSIFVREGTDGRVPAIAGRPIDWLRQHRAVVSRLDPSYEFAIQNLPPDQIMVEPTPAATLRRLAGGDGDYVLIPESTGLALLRSNGFDNLRALPTTVDAYTRSLAFAVREGDPELLEELEGGMVILTENGTYLRIYNQWKQYSAEEGPDLRWLLGVLGATVFLLGLSTVWSWSLRRTVARRTTALRAEEAERRRLEAQIQQTQKLESLGILAGGVAHDFNNLLMGILGNASLARHTEPGPKLEERLADIERAGRRAAELTEQMLAYSGKGSFQVRRLDLSRCVQDLDDWLAGHVSDDARVALDLTFGLPAVEGDADQIRQLLKHLITNASEALEDGRGIIRLATWSRYYDAGTLAETYLHPRLPAGSYVVLEVSDDGTGMEPSVEERVFDPFFSTKFTGRGLGMAAVLGIVRGHRGAIRIDSTPGEGTRVRVFLPAADAVGTADDDDLDDTDPGLPEADATETWFAVPDSG